MATPNRPLSQNKYTEQNMGNTSFDEDFGVNAVETLGYDGSNLVRSESDDIQTKVVESGGYTYICKAAVGTAENAAGWKIFRIDTAGSKMYADGDANYDNVASDPTGLSYSYT